MSNWHLVHEPNDNNKRGFFYLIWPPTTWPPSPSPLPLLSPHRKLSQKWATVNFSHIWPKVSFRIALIKTFPWLGFVVVVVVFVFVVVVVVVVVINVVFFRCCWSRNLPIKFGQNRVSSSWDITDILTLSLCGWWTRVILMLTPTFDMRWGWVRVVTIF